MPTFKALYQRAVKNRGSVDALEAALPKAKSAAELKAISDDRYLSMAARCIFRAGFVWKVIDNKWPGFEAAFSGFNPLGVAHFSDDKLDELAQDTRIVRNLQKITAVRDNAVMMLDKQKSHGSFAQFIADWPEEDIVGLWLELKKKGARLGGNTGPMLLRSMGKDTFIITNDVADALVHHGLTEKFSANSARDLQRVQDVFVTLKADSGRSLCEISRILAYTV